MLLALTYSKQTCFCTLAPWVFFLMLSLGPQCRYCSSHAGLQGTDGLGLKRAYSPLQRLSSPEVRRSKAVEPASLEYLEAEEEEELLSFHACKIQCGKALVSDILSS